VATPPERVAKALLFTLRGKSKGIKQKSVLPVNGCYLTSFARGGIKLLALTLVVG
jgi:hypothetical protein